MDRVPGSCGYRGQDCTAPERRFSRAIATRKKMYRVPRTAKDAQFKDSASPELVFVKVVSSTSTLAVATGNVISLEGAANKEGATN